MERASLPRAPKLRKVLLGKAFFSSAEKLGNYFCVTVLREMWAKRWAVHHSNMQENLQVLLVMVTWFIERLGSKPTGDFLPDVGVVVFQPTNQHFIELPTTPVALSGCQPFFYRLSEFVGVEPSPNRRHSCNEIGNAHRRNL